MTVYEGDIASLSQRHRLVVEPLLQRLHRHLGTAGMIERRGMVRDIEARSARFEQHKQDQRRLPTARCP